jgi:cathepsin A (carboxypeptidase C)
MIVNEMFQGDWMHNYQTQIPEQLADGIRVLIYAGDQDYICNWIGNKAWTVAMEWAYKAEFNAAADAPWTVDAKEAGKLRSSNGFSFLQVYDAGHMVPLDQPERALAMANAFMRNTL